MLYYTTKNGKMEIKSGGLNTFIKNKNIGNAQRLNEGYELNLTPDKKLLEDIRERGVKEISNLLCKRHYTKLLNVAKSYQLENYEPATPYIQVAKVMIR